MNKRQSCFDKLELAIGILMCVSKADYCLLNSLILAKLHSYELDIGSQNVLETFKVLDLSSSQEYLKDKFSVHFSLRSF